jgi:hypothetical protein
MRIIILIFISLSFLSVNSQTPLDYSIINSRPVFSATQQTTLFSSPWHKQWQFSTFGGLYTSYGFLNRGNAAVLSAPVGLQLTRRLNTNWYAFAGLSAAPAFLNFNSSFRDPGFNKTYLGNMQNNTNIFGVYPRAEAGFLYINNEKSFSISGSIHVDKTSYPLYPSHRTGMIPQRPVNGSF